MISIPPLGYQNPLVFGGTCVKQHIKITLHTSKQSHNWLDFHHKSLWEPIRKGHELFMRQRKFQLALAQTTIGCFCKFKSWIFSWESQWLILRSWIFQISGFFFYYFTNNKLNTSKANCDVLNLWKLAFWKQGIKFCE